MKNRTYSHIIELIFLNRLHPLILVLSFGYLIQIKYIESHLLICFEIELMKSIKIHNLTFNGYLLSSVL